MRGLRLTALLSVIVLCSVGWFLPEANAPNLSERFVSPSFHNWAGTDHLGRDVLSRTLQATAHAPAINIGDMGSSRPHNNIPPYIAIHFCKKNQTS